MPEFYASVRFTRLDAIADILFSAAEEIKQDEESVEVEDAAAPVGPEGPKFKPVAFHEACVQRVQAALGVSLVKRSRAGYSSPDKDMALNCSVSKEHNPETNPNIGSHFIRTSRSSYVHIRRPMSPSVAAVASDSSSFLSPSSSRGLKDRGPRRKMTARTGM